MMGGAIHKPETNKPVVVRHTEEVVAKAGTGTDAGKVFIDAPTDHLTGATLHPTASEGHPIRLINLGGGVNSTTAGARTQITSGTMTDEKNEIKFINPKAGINEATAPTAGDHIRIFWEEVIENASGDETAIEVTISPDTFPGTYRVVGDTFMRSQDTGKDEAFQFVIGKAKVASNVTITLEAEGDPSTFEMQLTVLRDKNDRGENEMMKLIRYAIAESATSGSEDDIGSLTPGSSM
jgi:hypothetical protein